MRMTAGASLLTVVGVVSVAAFAQTQTRPQTDAPVPASGSAQTSQAQASEDVLTLEVTPPRLTLAVGERTTLSAAVRDADGAPVDDATVVFYSRSRRSVAVTRRGAVEAFRPGEFMLVALVPENPDDQGRRAAARVRVEIPVVVPPPPVERVTFVDVPPKFYVGTRPRLQVEAVDTLGTRRPRPRGPM